MFLSVVYAATVALLSLPSFVYASPLVARAGHGVWNPPITAPGAGDVWAVGSTQLVTWNTDNIPPSAVNRTGTLLLGYLDEGTHGENLDTYRPLADGFPLTDRYVRILVPDVKPRDTYIVVLMGNSGNASPEFRIVKDRSNPAITHEAFDDTISRHNPDGHDSEVGPVDTEQIPNESHPHAQCKGRHSGSGSGRTSGHAEDTPPDQGPDKPC